MYDHVKTLGTVIRKARGEQGMSQVSLTEKLSIDVRTIINIESFHGNLKSEVLCPLVTTLRIPVDRILHPETESIDSSKQQLFWELHDLSEEKTLEPPPVICCLAEIVRKYGSGNP